MFIDLICFLRWTMWHMGLVLIFSPFVFRTLDRKYRQMLIMIPLTFFKLRTLYKVIFRLLWSVYELWHALWSLDTHDILIYNWENRWYMHAHYVIVRKWYSKDFLFLTAPTKCVGWRQDRHPIRSAQWKVPSTSPSTVSLWTTSSIMR